MNDVNIGTLDSDFMPVVGASSEGPATGQIEQAGREIPDDIRRRIIALHKITFWTRMKLVALLAIWGGCATLAIHFHSLWVRLPCWIIIGFVLHSLGVFMHEGAHGSLFRKPWLDRPIGFLCGL